MTGVFKRGNMADYACLPDAHGEPFDVRYDRNGFRNERDLTQADVAMIGDSYVEAPYAATSVLSSSVLARSLGQTVANLGMSGYGPQQELAVLRRFAAPLHPRTAVWVFFEGNDLEDISRYHRLHDNWPVERARAHGWWARSFTKNALLAGGRLMTGCTPSPDYAKRYGVTRDGQGRDVRMYFAEKPARIAPGHLAALTELQSIFAEAHRLADERGMQLVVAFAPIAYRVYRDVASFDEASEELKSWRLNDLPDRLRGMLAGISPDIRFVDLTPDLNAAARAGRLVYMPDDTHWTAEGHAVVGETLARAVGATVH